MKRKILSFMLVLSLCLGFILPISAAEGDGSSENPFLISDAYDLAALAAQVNEGENSGDMYYRLTNDIDLSGWITEHGGSSGWTPIGRFTPGFLSSPYLFNGNFDGAGYSITGLTISSRGGVAVGLFGSLGELGVLSNLTVCTGEDEIYLEAGGLDNAYGGLLLGYNAQGSIVNCHAVGKITGSYNTEVGLLVGRSYNGSISRCSATGTAEGGGRVGGFMGSNDNSTVINCFTTAEVIGTTTEDFGFHYGGGFAGFSSGTMANCYSTGAVTILFTPDTNTTLGGFMARLSKPTTTCYWNAVDNDKAIGSNSVWYDKEDVVGLSPAEMKTPAFAALLNKNTPAKIWAQDDSINDGFPYFDEDAAVIDDGALDNSSDTADIREEELSEQHIRAVGCVQKVWTLIDRFEIAFGVSIYDYWTINDMW